MDDEAVQHWGVAIRNAGIKVFAADIVDFPLRLVPAPVGRIGHGAGRMLAALCASTAWLNDAAVQTRLGAFLFYQAASQQPTQVAAKTGRTVRIFNPLFGATLLADAAQAGNAVTRLLADAARHQDEYLTLTAAIPEWCEFRIYQLSSAPSGQIAWLLRNRRLRRRRISALIASQRR